MAEELRQTPYSFLEIQDELARRKGLRPDVYQNFDVPTFTDFMQQMGDRGNAGAYTAGQRDPFYIKSISSGVERGLNQTGVPQAIGDVTGGLSKLISPRLEEPGREFGQHLPRMAGELATMAVPYVGVPLGLASMGADTFTHTDSLPAAAITVGSMGTMNKFGGLGRDAAVKAITKWLPGAAEATGAKAVAVRGLEEAGRFTGFAANQELATNLSSFSTRQPGQDWFGQNYTPESIYSRALSDFLMFGDPRSARDIVRGPKAEGSNFESFTQKAKFEAQMDSMKQSDILRTKQTMDQQDVINKTVDIDPSVESSTATVPDGNDVLIGDRAVTGGRDIPVRQDLSEQAQGFLGQDLNQNELVSQTVNSDAWQLAREHGMTVKPTTTLGDVQTFLRTLDQGAEQAFHEGESTLLGSSAPETHLPSHTPELDESGQVRGSIVRDTSFPNQPEQDPAHLLAGAASESPRTVPETDRLLREFSIATKYVMDTLGESYSHEELQKALGLDPKSNLPLNDSVLRKWFSDFHENSMTKTPDEVLESVVNRVKAESEGLLTALNTERLKRINEIESAKAGDESKVEARQKKYVEKLQDLPKEFLDHYAKTVQEASKGVPDSNQMSRLVTNAAMRYFGPAEHYQREGLRPKEALTDFSQWASNMGSAVARERERQASQERQHFVSIHELEATNRDRVTTEQRDVASDEYADPNEVDFVKAVDNAPSKTKQYWFDRIKTATEDPKFWDAVRAIKGSHIRFDWGKYQDRMRSYIEFLQTSGTDKQGSEVARQNFLSKFQRADGRPMDYEDTGTYRTDMFSTLNKALRDSGLLGEYDNVFSSDDVKLNEPSPSLAGKPESPLRSMHESAEGVVKGKDETGYTFAGVRRLFNNAFGKLGYSEASRNLFTEMALRVSQTFKGLDNVNVTEILDSGARTPGSAVIGVHIPEGNVLTNGTRLDRATIGLYAKEYFKDKTLDAFLKVKTLGHELGHALSNMLVGEGRKAVESVGLEGSDQRRLNNYRALYDRLNGMSVSDRYTLVKGLMEVMVPSKYYLDPKTGQVDLTWDGMIKHASSSAEETLAEVSGLASSGIAATSMNRGVVDGMKSLILFGDKHLSDFTRGYFRDISNMGDVVSKYFDGIETVKGGEKTVTPQVKEILKTVRDLARRPKDLDRAVETMTRITENTDPMALFNKAYSNQVEQGIVVDDMSTIHAGWPQPSASVIGAVNTVGEAMGLGKKPEYIKLQKEDPSFFQVWHPWQQIAERYPVLKPLVGILSDWRSSRARFAIQNMAPLLTRKRGGKVVVDPESSVAMVAKDRVMTDAVGDILRRQNEVEQVLTEDGMRQVVSKYNLKDERLDNVMNAAKNLLEVSHNFANAMVKGQQDDVGNILGSMLMGYNKGLKATDAKGLGDKLFTLELLQRQGQPGATESYRQILGQFKPEQAIELSEYTREIGNSFIKFADHMSKRSWFTTERRVGDYLVEYTRNGQKVTRGVASEAEVTDLKKSLDNDPTIKGFRATSKLDRLGEFHGLDDQTVQAFLSFEREAYDATLKRLGPEEADKLRQVYQPGATYLQEIKKRQLQGALTKRKLAGGREDLNMIQSSLDYFQGVSYGLARKFIKGQTMLALKDPELAARPDLQNLAYEKVDRAFNQPSKEWDVVNKGTALSYMAGNLSSALLEGTQVLQQLMPRLTRYGAGIGEGYKTLLGAASDLAKAHLSKGEFSLKDKGEDTAFKRARDEHVVSYGFMDDLNWHDDVDPLQIKRLTDGKFEEQSRADLVKNTARYAVKLSMYPKTKMNELNSMLGFLTSYRFKTSKGASPEEAYQFAKESVTTTNFSGGRVLRPLALDRLGEHSGVAGFVSTLQGYNMNALAVMFRQGYESLGKTGLQGQELHNARTGFAQALLTLVGTAGALGLPGLAAGMSLIENTTGLQVNKTVRQGLTALGGDDEELGGLIRDTALKGLFYRSGLDISGRVGLANVYGIDPNSGFSTEGIFGAPGSLIKNLVSGVSNLVQGQVGQGVQDLAPQALKPLIDLYRNDGKFYDKQGNLLFEPNTAQQVMYAVGFRPSQLSEFRSAQAMMTKTDQVATRERANWYKGLADLLIQGKSDQVRQALLEKETQDQTFSAKSGLAAVVQYAQDKLLPKDLLQEAPNADWKGKAEVAATFQQQPRVSQVDRITLAAQLAQSVGIPGAPVITSRKMQHASAIDQIVRQYPFMSRSQASQVAEKAGF